MDNASLARVMAELAAASTDDFTTDDMLQRLCRAAADHLSVDGAGVMSVEQDRTRFVHASHQQVVGLERLQQTLQSGPCRDAVDTRQPVMAAAPSQLSRWPAFADTAREAGIKSVLAIPLVGRSQVWGVLDLYWTEDHIVEPDQMAAARWLADTAAFYVMTAADRREAAQAREHLAHRLLHDQLTGLANRQLIHEMTSHALTAAARRGTAVALLFIDLDHFKGVNDAHGHLAGDLVLQTTARQIRSVIRASDTAGRLAGDEFIVLCEDLRDSNNAADLALTALATRIQTAINEPITIPGGSLIVTASIGVAISAAHPSAADLIHEADLAMYEAKSRGRHQVVLHRYHSEAGSGPGQDLERDLAEALHRNELRVYYQPIVTADATVIAVEALLRWDHPERGTLTAAEFIDFAETTGAIIPIGRWVIDQAAAQLAHWQRRYPDTAPQVVFCNVSPKELIAPGLSDVITAALATHQLSADQLALEITEAQLADPRLHTALTHYHRAGHPLAIDDFGVGYSSLSRLIDLPVDYLKIDRSLTAELPHDGRARALLEAVLTIADKLHLQVISEGVETPEQSAHISRAGCHLQQGYLHGHAQPASYLTRQLDSTRA